MYDVVIIGAGVTGAAVARALSGYELKVAVLEREEDVCCGTSKVNSGIVHAGFDAVPGTAKARYNIRGSRMMEQLCRELDIPYRRCGALVVCTERERLDGLDELRERGIQNGVEGLAVITDPASLRTLEPNLAAEAVGALYAPSSAVVCPFELTLGMAEQAKMNGVDFFFETGVEKIGRVEEGYRLETSQGIFESTFVINAAGVDADRFHNMVSSHKIHITARRGEYCLLDRQAGDHVGRTIFALPGRMGKGVLVTPTVHGNLIVGPTAEDIPDKRGTRTTREGLEAVRTMSARTVDGIPMRQVITSFAGLRAHEEGDDFLVGEAADAPGFIDCAGIESPGLTSAPAIGEAVAGMVAERMPEVRRKAEFIRTRRGIPRIAAMPEEEYRELLNIRPDYGKIVCRCETVSEGEILDAIHRPLGARSLDGVKRRTRAGMGRCQGGFCSPRVMELISRELGIPVEEITKCGGESRLILDRTKDRKVSWRREEGTDEDM